MVLLSVPLLITVSRFLFWDHPYVIVVYIETKCWRKLGVDRKDKVRHVPVLPIAMFTANAVHVATLARNQKHTF